MKQLGTVEIAYGKLLLRKLRFANNQHKHFKIPY